MKIASFPGALSSNVSQFIDDMIVSVQAAIEVAWTLNDVREQKATLATLTDIEVRFADLTSERIAEATNIEEDEDGEARWHLIEALELARRFGLLAPPVYRAWGRVGTVSKPFSGEDVDEVRRAGAHWVSATLRVIPYASVDDVELIIVDELGELVEGY